MRIHLAFFIDGIHANTNRLKANALDGLTWNGYGPMMELDRIHIIRKSELFNPFFFKLDLQITTAAHVMTANAFYRKNSNATSRIILVHQDRKTRTSAEILTASAQIFTDFRCTLFTHRFILPKARTARHNKNIQAVKPTFTNILTVKKCHINIRRARKYFSPINNVLASTALIAIKTCFYPWARNKI